ncbi:hypothetical protein N7519_009566 [Penicillium mononematosum]|uniref:uncharacterized protein n=1 Tax=Penicillium mononematosum TaxID=268346 RepID=UPI00254975A9|nr:uncharacterized protein N7519_009566 [Penicillium mononematosum]KAJ6179105.1 hypothetical protein N7519_009566 [Penicillium mononematosum]
MSESPTSERYMYLTRYSTPVPELDDHRLQMQTPPRIEVPVERSYSPHDTTQGPEILDRPDLLSAQDARRDGPIPRDFENADDNRSLNELNGLGRRFSVDHNATYQTPRRISIVNPDLANASAASSVSARSSSPPNSVEAFADPRRRERANTLDSHAPPDLEAILQRTVSGGTHNRRPTFSNASAIHPQLGDVPFDTAEEACFEEPGRIPVIDYEELEEFVALNPSIKVADADRRKYSMSSQSKRPRIFYDLRPGAESPEIGAMKKNGSSDTLSEDGKKESAVTDEKERFKTRQNVNQRSRFGFFSSESQSTVHAADLGDLVLPGETFRDLFELGPEGGVWWLDVANPTDEELGAISRAFSIHPLTTEDIQTQEAREKVELFKQYYFVCFRTFFQTDKTSEEFLEPVNFYMVVFRDGVLTFSFEDNPHAANVRKRIGKLRDYVALSSDWICYAMIDDIVDSFGPVIRDVELESEAIEDHVFIARVDDFESFLPRIGGLRKKVMSLMRLLGGKADVIRGFSKRCNEQYSVTPRGDIGLYLGDIQDHVVTMMSNLAHFEKMLSRSHTNYLAQLNVTNLVLGNHVNKVLSKVTLIATILVPMNLITGLFGMNVEVPGAHAEGLNWWFGILGVIAGIVVEEVYSWCIPPLASDKFARQLQFCPLAVQRHPPRRPSMRRQYNALQCYITATISAIFILFALTCDSVAYAYSDAPNGPDTESTLNLRGVDTSDGAGLPFALDSFNGLELRDSVDEDGESNGLELVRRYPNAVKALGNNQFEESKDPLEIGAVHWYYLPKTVVNGKHDPKGAGLPAYMNATDEDNDADDSASELRKRDEDFSKRALTTVYLSLTTCKKTTYQQNRLTRWVPAVASPGPGKDDSQQDIHTAVGGYVGITVDTDSDVFIGVAAPNSTDYTGSYTYQIAASIDDFFHNIVDNDPNLFFIDADVSAALLVTNNLTQSAENSTNYQQWMDIVPPYTMFAHNINDTALQGLEKSFCALDTLSQVGRISNSTEVGMTNRGLGNKPKEQFYITGLNQSSSYSGLLAMVGNSTASGNGIIGGGGKVWQPMNFTTKADDNCAVLFNLTFCSEVAYAVPSNPKLSVDKLRTIYDDHAAAFYQNFIYSLQQVQCKTNEESMFSLAVNCDDCARSYKQWLCGVTIPRCADYSSDANYLAVRNAGQPFINGSSLPDDSPYRQSVASNTSRNSIIDEKIKPGPYKEILPCQDICHTLVKDCPSALGFGCPEGAWMNASYGYRNSDGIITCSYLGAVYYLNLGAKLGAWDWVFSLVVMGVMYLL